MGIVCKQEKHGMSERGGVGGKTGETKGGWLREKKVHRIYIQKRGAFEKEKNKRAKLQPLKKGCEKKG